MRVAPVHQTPRVNSLVRKSTFSSGNARQAIEPTLNGAPRRPRQLVHAPWEFAGAPGAPFYESPGRSVPELGVCWALLPALVDFGGESETAGLFACAAEGDFGA